ncbi:MAG: UPF0182 family protein [Acidimicrobiia bacterium]
MRAVPTVGRRPPAKRWIVLGAIAGVLLLALVLLPKLATFYTDYLWFDALGQSGSWREQLSARVVPSLIFTVFFFVALVANLAIADRLAPTPALGVQEDELVARYREVNSRYGLRIRVGLSLVFAVIAGLQVSAHWQEWILFSHSQKFGAADPQFGRDIGFYVFQLPFLQFAADWLFATFVIIFIVTLVAHYLNGGIRLQGPDRGVTPQVKAHLSVLLGIIALVKAGQYYLGRYALNSSTRGFVQGATYTDVKAQIPAFNLLILIAVVAAVLFLLNIWRKGWALPIIAVGLWALVSVVVGAAYPAYVQRFQVQPDQLSKERPYIVRNIAGTQRAFGLDQVQTKPFDYKQNLDRAVIDKNQATINNVRLWDPEQLRDVYQKLQAFRSQDVFTEVDADRYTVDGRVVPVMTGGRDLNEDRLPSRTWVNQHLFYTSGYGSVVTRANEVASGDLPSFLLQGIPPTGVIADTKQPQLYFGEGLNDYVVVDSKRKEFLPVGSDPTQQAETTFTGNTGIELSSFVRRAAAFMRFSDVNLLISDQITSKSQLMFDRDITQRVQKLAPFLKFDADPYLTVSGGKQYWIIDGYTISNSYPYSETYNPDTAPPGELAGKSGLNTSFNYVRNSVKVAVDAYDGSAKFYVVDESDPMVKAYRSAFPTLFTGLDSAPNDLVAHFRYPEDLFRVQTTMYAQYHVTNPDDFFGRNNLWSVMQDPSRTTGSSTSTTVPQLGADVPVTTVPRGAGSDRLKVSSRRVSPLYQTMAIPQDPKQAQQFVLTRPFVRFGRETQLASFMIARSDLTKEQWKSSQGRLAMFEVNAADVNAQSGAPTPVRITGDINTNPYISKQFSLLDQGDSTVDQGEIQLVPVGDSILFFRPVYVRNRNEPEAFPRFRFLIAGYGSNTVLGCNVDSAINALLFNGPQADAQGSCTGSGSGSGSGENVAPTPTPPSTTTTSPTTATTVAPSGDEAAIITQLQAAAAEYDAAVQAQPYDAGRIQRAADQMAKLIAQLQQVRSAK